MTSLPGARVHLLQSMSGLRSAVLGRASTRVLLTGAVKAGRPRALSRGGETVCDLIPLSLFRLDYEPPVTGWGPLLEAEGVEVVEDDIGRPAIAAGDAAHLIGARRAAEAYRAAERARWEDETRAAAIASTIKGAPAVPGESALASMFTAYPPDRPKSAFQEMLDEELSRGACVMAWPPPSTLPPDPVIAAAWRREAEQREIEQRGAVQRGREQARRVRRLKRQAERISENALIALSTSEARQHLRRNLGAVADLPEYRWVGPVDKRAGSGGRETLFPRGYHLEWSGREQRYVRVPGSRCSVMSATSYRGGR